MLPIDFYQNIRSKLCRRNKGWAAPWLPFVDPPPCLWDGMYWHVQRGFDLIYACPLLLTTHWAKYTAYERSVACCGVISAHIITPWVERSLKSRGLFFMMTHWITDCIQSHNNDMALEIIVPLWPETVIGDDLYMRKISRCSWHWQWLHGEWQLLIPAFVVAPQRSYSEF